MQDFMQYILISVIGQPMYNDTDPIYEVAMRFPPSEIFLISSDEPDQPHRDPTTKNVELISEHFAKTKTSVKYEAYNLHDFDNNVIKLASIIIQYYKMDKKNIVLDMSAGRGSIRQALSRAGDVAVEYIHQFFDPYFSLTGAIRSKNQPIVIYEIGNIGIPNERDAELLLVAEENLSQTALTQKLGWSNQSEISKSLKRLSKMNLIEIEGHRNRRLTLKGQRIRELLLNVKSN